MNTLSEPARIQAFNSLYTDCESILDRPDVKKGLKPLGVDFEAVHAQLYVASLTGNVVDAPERPHEDGIAVIPMAMGETREGVIESRRMYWPTAKRLSMIAGQLARKKGSTSPADFAQQAEDFAREKLEVCYYDQPFTPLAAGQAAHVVDRLQTSPEEPMFSSASRIYFPVSPTVREANNDTAAVVLHEAVHADDSGSRETCYEDQTTYRFPVFTELRAWHLTKVLVASCGLQPHSVMSEVEQLRERFAVGIPESPAEITDPMIIAAARIGILGHPAYLDPNRMPESYAR